MKTSHILALTVFAAAIAAASPMLAETQQGENARAPMPSEGTLGTLPHGTYQCALPGDAAGASFDEVKDEEFRIGAASKYRSAHGTGSYILRGKELTFTRGPKKGERYKRISTNQLRKLDGATETKLLCTRLSSNS